jgi:hypothetical protein
MINKKITGLLQRVQKIEANIVLTQNEISNVERKLNIILPNNFKELCHNCSYEIFNFSEFYNFGSESTYSVITQTLGWRKSINLPHNYLVLGDDGTSAILMKIEGNESSVIWCSLEDVLNICKGLPMKYDPTVFPTFTDFYEFLLDEEEKSRNDEKKQQTV